MGRGDNYPDDIRNYDHDPRSPFYESGPECDECGEEMSVEIDADEDGRYVNTICENWDCPACPNYEEPEEEFDEED